MLLLLEEDTQEAFWQGQLVEAIALARRDAKNAWYRNEIYMYHSIMLFACREDFLNERPLRGRFVRYFISWYHFIFLYRKRNELSVAELDILAQFLIDEYYRWEWFGIAGKKLRKMVRDVVQGELIHAEQPSVDVKDKAVAFMTAAEVGDLLDDKDMVSVYVSFALKLRPEIEKENAILSECCVISLFQRAAWLMYSINNILMAYQWAVFASTRPMNGPAASVYQVECMTHLLDKIYEQLNSTSRGPA